MSNPDNLSGRELMYHLAEQQRERGDRIVAESAAWAAGVKATNDAAIVELLEQTEQDVAAITLAGTAEAAQIISNTPRNSDFY